MRSLIECARQIVRDVRGVRRIAIVALIVLCVYLHTREVEGMRVHPDAEVDATHALARKYERVKGGENIVYRPVLEGGVITTTIRDQVTLREFLRYFDTDDSYGKSDRQMVVEWFNNKARAREAPGDPKSVARVNAWYDKQHDQTPLANLVYRALIANIACVSRNYQVSIRDYLLRRLPRASDIDFSRLDDPSYWNVFSYSDMQELAKLVLGGGEGSEAELRERLTKLGDGIYSNALIELVMSLAIKEQRGIDSELFEILPFVDMVYFVIKHRYDQGKSPSKLFEHIDGWFHNDSVFRDAILHYDPTRLNPRVASYADTIFRRASVSRVTRAINEYILERRLVEYYKAQMQDKSQSDAETCNIAVGKEDAVENGRNVFMTIVSAYIDTRLDVGEREYDSYYGHDVQPRDRRDDRIGVLPSTLD